jgi:molybdopterin-binding protein
LLGEGLTISAIITHESSKKMGLAVDGSATAIIKASTFIIGVNLLNL